LAAGPLTFQRVVANAFWVAHRIGWAPAIDWGKRPVFAEIQSGAVVNAVLHCAIFSRGAFLTLEFENLAVVASVLEKR